MSRFIKHDVCNLLQIWTLTFHRQWGNILWVWWDVFVYNLLLFLMVKDLKNRLGFDKVIAINWWSTFLGHSVVWMNLTVILNTRNFRKKVEVKSSEQYMARASYPCTDSRLGMFKQNISCQQSFLRCTENPDSIIWKFVKVMRCQTQGVMTRWYMHEDEG